jgi:ATP phosphoribosyltransferase
MNTLKIAVQKSGRLKDDSMKLLKDIGINSKLQQLIFLLKFFTSAMVISLNTLKMESLMPLLLEIMFL